MHAPLGRTHVVHESVKKRLATLRTWEPVRLETCPVDGNYHEKNGYCIEISQVQQTRGYNHQGKQTKKDP
jgi:hypothetical protein